MVRAMQSLARVRIRPRKYETSWSRWNECVVPTSLVRNLRVLSTCTPYWPKARTGSMTLYFGSWSWIGSPVPHFTSSGMVRFVNQTSAVNGERPNGRLISFERIGRFSVDRVCRPGPNGPSIWPPRTSTASCDSLTMSCVQVESSWWGLRWAYSSLLSASHLTTR